MSRVVTYQLPDEIYEAFEQMAAISGRPTEALVLEYLARHASTSQSNLSEQERLVAEQRFDECIGSVDLGHPTGADNESIDRDLGREYADTHENET